MAVNDISGYEAGNIYQIKGTSQSETLGNCYLIKSLTSDIIDEYPKMYTENNFLNVNHAYH